MTKNEQIEKLWLDLMPEQKDKLIVCFEQINTPAFSQKGLLRALICQLVLMGILLLFPGGNPWSFCIETLPRVDFSARLFFIGLLAISSIWLGITYKKTASSAESSSNDFLIMCVLIQEGCLLCLLIFAQSTPGWLLICLQAISLLIGGIFYAIGCACSQAMFLKMLRQAAQAEKPVKPVHWIAIIVICAICCVAIALIRAAGSALFILPAQCLCCTLFFLSAIARSVRKRCRQLQKEGGEIYYG